MLFHHYCDSWSTSNNMIVHIIKRKRNIFIIRWSTFRNTTWRHIGNSIKLIQCHCYVERNAAIGSLKKKWSGKDRKMMRNGQRMEWIDNNELTNKEGLQHGSKKYLLDCSIGSQRHVVWSVRVTLCISLGITLSTEKKCECDDECVGKGTNLNWHKMSQQERHCTYQWHTNKENQKRKMCQNFKK